MTTPRVAPTVSDEAGAPRPSRRSRRATRPAPEGVDPRPASHPLTAQAGEDRPEGWGEASGSDGAGHDAELERDRPPHWG